MEIDARKVIEKLVAQIGRLTYEISVLQAQLEQLNEQEENNVKDFE